MKVVLNDESVDNDYGFRVLNSGIDLTRFKSNPVVLMQHMSSSLAIGKVANLSVEGFQLTGYVEWDENDTDPDVKRLISKYKNGFMKGFSMGLRIVEFSSDLAGNENRIATKSELYELSAETLQSNPNAVTVKLMNNDSDLVRLGYNKEEKVFIHKNKEVEMLDLKKLAAAVNLTELATEGQILAAIEAMNLENTQLRTAQMDGIVTLGKNKGIITAENEAHYRRIGGLDFATLKSIVEVAPAANPQTPPNTEGVKDTDIVFALKKLGATGASSVEGREDWSYNDWLEKDNAGLVRLKANAPDKFKALIQKQESAFKAD